MKVVIFCGGKGSRIKEFTENVPKPMIEIGGIPIISHIMKYYSSYGYNDFILPLGYKATVIKDYFKSLFDDGDDILLDFSSKTIETFRLDKFYSNWNVKLKETGLENLKGSRLKQIQSEISGDTFLLTYGDCLSDVPIDKLIAFHQGHGKMVTLTGVRPGARFGSLKIDGESVTDFVEKNENNTNYVNGGFFVLNTKIFDYLNIEESCDFEFQVLEHIARVGELMVFKHEGNWAPLDNLRDYEYLESLSKTNKAFWAR